jgi:sterol desaturase/sphingolipid hydroxylase (fatty acid hydroxylase superfamily)
VFRRMRSVRRLFARIASGTAVVVVSALALWFRQNSEATLRVNSFYDAMSQSLFWSAPTVVLVVTLFRLRSFLMLATLGATVGLGLTWWGTARNWHSTAAVGPALMGWIVLPAGLVALRIGERRLKRRSDAEGSNGPDLL